MNSKILSFTLKLILFTVILYLGQYFLINNTLENRTFYYPAQWIYIFNFIATFLSYLFLLFVYSRFKESTGFAFMGSNFVKMVAAVIFLFPMLLNYEGNAFGNLMSFFIPYFLYLIFETFYAVKLLNSK